jgi:plastocyanin
LSLAYFRFLPDSFTIHTGDTVVFTNNDVMPHMVSFNGTEGYFVPLINYADFSENPIYLTPISGDDYDGESFITSGDIMPALLDQVTPRWSVTFTKAGVYPYICAYHSDLGMAASVTVVDPPKHHDKPEHHESGAKTVINFNFEGLIPANY